jgi:L-ornithine N5-oxygenase
MIRDANIADPDGNELDVLGIGFGPANIALAIAAEELGSSLRLRFVEQSAQPGWQEDMLLPEADIQNHPLRDLVTPRNPRSRYTFVNFLFEHNRLFEHLNLPLVHPLRIEYRQYVRWVAQHFAQQVDYGDAVTALWPVLERGCVRAWQAEFASGRRVHARAVVLAPGRTPRVPPVFEPHADPRIVHLTRFASAFAALKQRKVAQPRVVIIGGSQSAVELLLHVAGELPEGGTVTGVTRNFGFRLKDTSPFSDEVYFPAFVDTFFHACPEQKARLRKELVFTNYSSADRDVLDALYVRLYRNKLLGRRDLLVRTMTEVEAVTPTADGVELTLRRTMEGSVDRERFDLVVLATGFKDLGREPGQEPYPALLALAADQLELVDGSLAVDLDYRVRLRGGHDAAPLFLNGLCESSHGMGDAGSLSLLSLRSAAILKALQRSLAPRASARCASPNEPEHPDVPLSLLSQH